MRQAFAASAAQDQRASTGPRSQTADEHRGTKLGGGAFEASTGPRSQTADEGQATGDRQRATERFNGAAVADRG